MIDQKNGTQSIPCETPCFRYGYHPREASGPRGPRCGASGYKTPSLKVAVAAPGEDAESATRSRTSDFITLTSDLIRLCALAERQRQHTSAPATGPDAGAYVKTLCEPFAPLREDYSPGVDLSNVHQPRRGCTTALMFLSTVIIFSNVVIFIYICKINRMRNDLYLA